MVKKNVHLVYIRNINTRDNEMLQKLSLITGGRSNASNLLLAGYLLVKKKNERIALRNKVVQLDAALAHKNDFLRKIKLKLEEIIDLEIRSNKMIRDRKQEFVKLLRQKSISPPQKI
jgi:hypothetical protein